MDPARLWEAEFDAASVGHLRAPAVDADLWDRGATDYELWLEHNDYPGPLLPRILAGVRPHDTVLEVGPGVGAITRHLLTTSAGVTVVEQSRAMLDRLLRRVGQSRLEVIHSRWEDVAEGTIGQRDVSVAVYSLFSIRDLKSAVEKLAKITRRRIVIVTHATTEDVIADQLWLTVQGRPYHPSPDYRYMAPVLASIGRPCAVQLIPIELCGVYRDPDHAVSDWQRRLGLGHDDKNGAIRNVLDQYLVCSGRVWTIPQPRIAAILTWNEEESL